MLFARVTDATAIDVPAPPDVGVAMVAGSRVEAPPATVTIIVLARLPASPVMLNVDPSEPSACRASNPPNPLLSGLDVNPEHAIDAVPANT